MSLYNRWTTIVATTPSGKTQFVCRICGRMSPIPDNTCPEGFKHTTLGNAYTYRCEDVEKAIHKKMAHEAPELLMWRNELALMGKMRCGECHGAGCQACVRPSTEDFRPHAAHIKVETLKR
jgi:hypothetical protein